ncbi:MAG: hypothetical protein KGI19_02615 [Thaumarchaeota archaeon]|nr:hypothetical protein [Nitrososphaerota archaeon]
MVLKWQIEHSKLAERELAKIIKELEKQSTLAKSLQPVPENILEFISKMKPMSEGNLRNLDITPFWKEIYQDPHPFKMILGGRQIYKSTYITDILTHEALTRPGAQLAYVTFSLKNLAAFSRQKLQGSFLQNPGLQKYLWKTSNIDEQSFRNGSRIYCTISINNYKNLEGKSLHHVILDESQEQPMHVAQKVIQTMVATKGDLTICGIGGESGSAYENFWNNSTQFEWVPNEPEWRSKLQFDEKGLVIGKYLEDLMTGKWVANNPNNTICHGYHIPQTMIPTNPITIDDAIKLYKVSPIFSIEYQKNENPDPSFYPNHIMGQFNRSMARPVTRNMVLQCMTPYKYIALLTLEEIAQYKRWFGNRIRISMGVDFGSGSSSSTVISIVIKWRLPNGERRYFLAFLDKRPAEDQLEQAKYIAKLFYYSDCDIGVGDLGYGANQIKMIQDGFINNDGREFSGAGSKKFIGCRTESNESITAPIFAEGQDEHGHRALMARIDKTYSIQRVIDLLNTKIVYTTTSGQTVSGPKFIIPYAKDYETDLLIKDFTGITRKDLEFGDAIDSRQKAKKEFNHPPDSVMSLVYAIVGAERKIIRTYLASTTDSEILDYEDFDYD